MSEMFPIGKYKGQPIERVLADRSYCRWLSDQAWFREKFSSFYANITNNVVIVGVGSIPPGKI